ncbi:hypothetical protein [Roseivirga sp.]|uniref:hypothetical protein n=1 Tax=Roseivirga sp. TaxID=1964215 RepID=UPI003B521F2B
MNFLQGGEYGRNGGDPKKPFFTANEKAGMVVAAVAGMLKMYSALGIKPDPELVEKMEVAMATLSEEDLIKIRRAYISATRDGYYDEVQQISDRQLFGALNPLLAEAAALYGINKDFYKIEKPWLSEEDRNRQKEEENRGRQAKELLEKAENGEIEAGFYTWDGSNWIKN